MPATATLLARHPEVLATQWRASKDAQLANRFIMVANIEAPDGGKAPSRGVRA